MVDYDKATGSTGIMKIRDTGTTIEFWLYAGSATWKNGLQWGYTTPHGNSGWQSTNFSGGDWRLLGSVNVTASGNVTFHLAATGTSGLGGPTDHTVYISRSTVPPPPKLDSAVVISSTAVRVTWSSTGDGNSPILEWQIGYGTHPSVTQQYVSGSSPKDVTGLTPGTIWYFWVRARNAVGWSGWSSRAAVTTWDIPSAPPAPVLSNVAQTSLLVQFNAPSDNGGTPITEYQIGYGKTSSANDSTIASNRSTTIPNLDPGQRYYFRARAKNAVGWGPWSTISNTYLLAGAKVKVGSTWKRAVPYVNVDGVWKVAKPYVRNGGVWKATE
jgi:hypothetical protein